MRATFVSEGRDRTEQDQGTSSNDWTSSETVDKRGIVDEFREEDASEEGERRDDGEIGAGDRFPQARSPSLSYKRQNHVL